jgi:hypothetical protein
MPSSIGTLVWRLDIDGDQAHYHIDRVTDQCSVITAIWGK